MDITQNQHANKDSELLLLDAIGKPYRIFADPCTLELGALRQFREAMEADFVVKGALMPDGHTGYSLPIGGVVACDGVVVPAFVGYDQGCGVAAVRTTFDIDAVRACAKKIEANIYRDIPVGFSHNQKNSVWGEGDVIPRSVMMDEIFQKNGLRQLGSLGGGNHFIEIGYDEQNRVWVTLHSGSRGIGHSSATHYMKLASPDGRAREGNHGLSVDTCAGKDYIMDLNFCLEFALASRLEMLHRVVAVMGRYCGDGAADWGGLINRNHNHAELKDGLWIHRKGATHAEDGMMGVIPGNMADGVFIVRGKGNPDSLYSSSHGAGRVMGRKDAQRTLNMESFIESMAGITATVGKGTLAESKFAYKDIFEVMRLQSDLIEVIAYVKPIINIKSSDAVE